MKKKLIKLFTALIPMMIFHNVFRYSLIALASRFSKHKRMIIRELEQPQQDKQETSLCFLLGSPRSGTTLTSILLDKSPNIFSPPELYLATFDNLQQRKQNITRTLLKSLSLGLIQCVSRLTDTSLSDSMAALKPIEQRSMDIESTYDYLLNKTEQPVFIDKTPCYVTYISEKLFRQRFPKAKYLYMYRHPISVILSQKKWLDVISDENVVKFGKRGITAFKKGQTGYFSTLLANKEAYCEFEAFKCDVYPKHNFDKFKILEAGWHYENKRALDFLDTIAEEQKYIFSFESLLKSPEEQLAKILAFLGVKVEPKAMIEAYEAHKAPSTFGGIMKEIWNWEVGDPNQIFMAGKLDGARADGWKNKGELWQQLEEDTRDLARRMGYRSSRYYHTACSL